jgi:branched-chain amino acid transport system substrate-binding protein
MMIGKHKRRAVAVVAAAASIGIAALHESAAEDKIKVGFLEDQTGEIAPFTLPKVRAAQLTVDEINAAGGILGRQLELIMYDPQFDNAKFQEFARRLLESDKVDVIFAGSTSASREAVRPVVNKNDALYFYTTQYEGGVCDANMVATGAVPEQQLTPLISWMMEKYGKRVYTIAADYNFGQISAEWTRTLVEKNGGEILGEELIPLGVSQFGQTIQNIQKAKPDWLMSFMVGQSQHSFYPQAQAAGLKLPMASSAHIAVAGEHKRYAPPTLEGMHVTSNWFEELEGPSATEYKKKWHAKFPEEKYISDHTENTYVGFYLYKKAAEMAGSIDKEAIRKAIATGNVCVDGPEGQVCIDPRSQHVSHAITLIKVNADHSLSTLQRWDKIEPYWLADIGCDLTKKDHNDQYTPSYLPKKD